MRETFVSKTFKEIAYLSDFEGQTPLLWPVFNTSQAGWPDCLVQFNQSRILAVEFKQIVPLRNGTYKIERFRNSQAAWFAKWQYNGGLCCLFIGVENRRGDIKGYRFITCEDWRDWLQMAKQVFIEEDNSLKSDLALLRQELDSFVHKNVMATPSRFRLTEPPNLGTMRA